MKGRRPFLISMRTLLPLALGAIVLLVLVPVMTAGYIGARDNTSRLLQSTTDAVLDGLEDQLRGALDPVALQMAAVARAVGAGRIDPADQEGFRRFMLGVLTGQANVTGIGFLEMEGPFRRWQRDGLNEVIEPRDSAFLANEIIESARRGDGARWIRPFVSMITRTPVLLHLQPAFRNGQLIGVFMTALTTETLSETIYSMNKDVTPFVLAGRETVIIHPNMREVMVDSQRLPSIHELKDRALSLLWTDQRRPFLNEPSARTRTHWTWLGDGYLAQQYHYRTMEGYGPDPWTIGYHVDSRATMRERWVVVALFYGSMIALALILLVAWIIGRRAARPAEAMAQAAARLEALDFGAVADPGLSTSRIREVRTTFQALNRAALALKRMQTYVPRVLVSRLVTMGDDRPNAVDAEVTVLFLDLAGYSAFSEGRSAGEVAAYLNSVFARVGPLIEQSGGTIDKYTGDGLLAVWGAPTPAADHARRAFQAAIAISDAMTPELSAALARDPRACRIRIGLHSGRVMAGDLGFEGRTDFTVVGRTVNTAQRAQAALKEGMGKSLVAVGVTETTMALIGEATCRFTRLTVFAGGEALYLAEGAATNDSPSRAISDEAKSA